ncbi:MAG TPA: glycosyltransferase family 2 protein [Terriglobales bacterium]|nr:glycosyltransferase family 2 protein [Terriglobales bacterium]
MTTSVLHALEQPSEYGVTPHAAGPEVSVVMPCLNEARTLGACLEKIQRTFRQHAIEGEIVVADNGSSDGSQNIARSMGARLVEVVQKGYGSALMGGIAAARGRYIVMGDADDTYNFTHIPLFLEKLRHGDELVMGNRFKGGIEPGAMPALHRYLGNPVLSFLGRVFFRSNIGDFHCGLRAFSKSGYEKLGMRTTGMEFASEMVVKATLTGLRVAEVPTTLSPDRRGRPPHLRTWRDGWRHLRFMLLYSPRWLFLYPGILLMFVGAAMGAWLLPGPRTVHGVTFDVDTLLHAMVAVLIGFQAVAFSVFTKIYATTEGLLPKDLRLESLFKVITLETGLVVGALLSVAGIAGSLYAVQVWKAHHFGQLNAITTLRIVMPSVTAMALGCQIIFFSFFLSVLGLARKR